jgi:hypothetical protein
MRKAIGASVIALALTVSAYAEGVMGNGATEPPPPPPSTQSATAVSTQSETASTESAGGVMGNGISETTEIALSLLQNLLALF